MSNAYFLEKYARMRSKELQVLEILSLISLWVIIVGCSLSAPAPPQSTPLAESIPTLAPPTATPIATPTPTAEPIVITTESAAATGDPPATPAEINPYPYTTPLPPPTPTLLDGVYLRNITTIQSTPVPCRRCPAYKLEGGNWHLKLEAGVFRVWHEVTGFRSVGSFTVSGDRITFFNDPNCHLAVGIYKWTLSAETSLKLELIEDECAFGLRAKNLITDSWLMQAGEQSQTADRCQPPSIEAAVTGHWPAPPGCQDTTLAQ